MDLINSKECIKCNEIKQIIDFPCYINRFGEKKLRNVCKSCYYSQSKKSRQFPFDEDDIQVLKEMISNFLEVKTSILSLKKTNRIVKTFNIENDIFDILLKYSKDNNISMSDAVNILIKKALEIP